MKKKVLLLLSSLAVLLLGAVFGGQAWLKGRLQKDALVAQMEEAWNCRAHLDDTSVSLFSRPASVKLIGLRLAPRDTEVSRPLAVRAALAADAAQITAQEAVLSVQLTDLLLGRLNVERLHLESLHVRNVVDEEGNGSLDLLFEPPSAAPPSAHAPPSVTGTGGSAVPGETPGAPPAPDSPETKKEPGPERRPMKASELRVNLAVKSAGVSNGRFESTDLKGGTKTTVEHLDVALTDIDVAPGDLANHNHASFSVSGSLKVEKTDRQQVVADFALEGRGTIEPFDSKTGVWKPDTDLEVTLRKGGLIGGQTLEKQMSPKDLEKFEKQGIKLGDIAIGGVLSQDVATKIHALAGGKLIIKQKTTFAFPQYEISVDEQSWFHAPQDLHNVKASLVISPELSARIVEDAKKALAEKAKKENVGFLEAAAAGLTDILAAGLMDDQKRLILPYRAKGKLSDPQPDFGGLWDDLKGGMLNKVLDGLFPSKKEEKEEQ